MVYLRRVVGSSMSPTLNEGSIIFATKWPNYKLGQIVIATMGGREVIKRIANCDGISYNLLGDNLNNSSDSRKYGPVTKKHILGKVIFKL